MVLTSTECSVFVTTKAGFDHSNTRPYTVASRKSSKVRKCLFLLQGVVSKDSVASFSRLIYYIFLPALIFTALGREVNVTNIAKWWFVLVNILIDVALGMLLASVMAPLCGVPKHLRPQYFACASIGALACGSLLLRVLPTLQRRTDQQAFK